MGISMELTNYWSGSGCELTLESLMSDQGQISLDATHEIR